MLIIPIELLVLALVALGSAAIALVTSKAHTSWMPSWLKQAVFFAVPLVKTTVDLAKWLANKYGGVYFSAEARVTKWFAQLAHYQYVVGYWSLLWPVALYHFGQRLLHHEVPIAINSRTKPIAKTAADAQAAAKAASFAANDAHHFAKATDRTRDVTRIERVAMPHAGEWDWIHDHYNTLKKVVAGAAAAAAGAVLPHAPSIGNPFAAIWKYIHSMRKDLVYWTTATGAAVLVARAIGGVSANCVKKGNIGRFARLICGLDSWLVKLLLVGLVEGFVANDLCAFSNLLMRQAQLIRPALMELVNVEDALIGCGGAEKPLVFNLPPASLPPLQGVSPLAA